MVVLESVSGSFAVFKQLVLGRSRINLLFNNGLDRISPLYYQGSPSNAFYMRCPLEQPLAVVCYRALGTWLIPLGMRSHVKCTLDFKGLEHTHEMKMSQ